MFYKDKIDRIFEAKSKEKSSSEDLEDLNKYKNQVELEKGDFLSMVIGAYYAFLPIFLVLFIILYLVRPWQ